MTGGDIIRTSCEEARGGFRSTQKYDCLAANERRGGGVFEGYNYEGTVNTKNGNLTWKLGG